MALLLASEQDDCDTHCQSEGNETAECHPRGGTCFDNDPVAEAYWMADGSGDSLLVYLPARCELAGFALNSYSNNGFSGNIQIMVGFDMEHRIVNYSAAACRDSGLGSKMTEWFRDLTKPEQSVIGRDLSKGALTVTKDGGDVDAITASTITSRAFLEAVNKAYAVYSGNMENTWSGATTATENETEETTKEGGPSNE